MLRDVIRQAVLYSGVMMTAGGAVAGAEEVRTCAGKTLGWRLGVQTYTFRQVTFLEAIEKVKALGLTCVEGFAWQKISPKLGKMQLNHKASPAALDQVRQALRRSGVRLVNYYVSNFGKDKAEMREIFAFAKKMGIEAFVAEPKAETIGALSKLADEFGVKVAIHNHPKRPKKPSYVNWDPDQVIKMIRGCGKNIGCCADTGHWIRSGLDPVACLKKYEGRLICLHMKDVDKNGHDVPYGTGSGNVKGQLTELKRQGFRGVIAIEYESKKGNTEQDVRQCVAHYNRVVGELTR